MNETFSSGPNITAVDPYLKPPEILETLAKLVCSQIGFHLAAVYNEI